MCNPGLVQVGATAAQAYSQFQQANRAAARQTERFDLNSKFAEDSRNRQMATLNSRIDQERLATGDRIQEVVRQAQQAEGFNVAAAADAGVGGEAIFAVLQDVERAATQRFRKEEINLEQKIEQIGEQKQSVVDRQFAAILSVPQGVKQSPLVPLLKVAGAFGDAYADGLFDGPTGGADIGGAAPPNVTAGGTTGGGFDGATFVGPPAGLGT